MYCSQSRNVRWFSSACLARRGSKANLFRAVEGGREAGSAGVSERTGKVIACRAGRGTLDNAIYLHISHTIYISREQRLVSKLDDGDTCAAHSRRRLIGRSSALRRRWDAAPVATRL